MAINNKLVFLFYYYYNGYIYTIIIIFFIKQTQWKKCKYIVTLYITLTLCLLYVLPFCASAAWMCRSDLICLDMLFFPPSDIKISSTHFASRQEM